MSSSRRRRPIAIVAALALAGGLSSGCVEVALQEAQMVPDYAPMLLPPKPDPTPGAIWRGDKQSGSFLFYDRKARGVGDLVTVRVTEIFSAEGTASTSLDNTSSLGASLTSDVGLGQALSQGLRWLLELVGVDDPGVEPAPTDAVSLVESTTDTSFEGDGETRREGRLEAIVTCRVLAEHPGGSASSAPPPITISPLSDWLM